MAHVTLHFSLGIIVASGLMLRPMLARWRADRPLAALFGRWLLLSYAAGFYASIPSLLRQAGLPGTFCDGWWMNVFLFYPAIKRLFTFGGMPLGGLTLGVCFTVQYAVVLVAILRARGDSSHPEGPPQVPLTHPHCDTRPWRHGCP